MFIFLPENIIIHNFKHRFGIIMCDSPVWTIPALLNATQQPNVLQLLLEFYFLTNFRFWGSTFTNIWLPQDEFPPVALSLWDKTLETFLTVFGGQTISRDHKSSQIQEEETHSSYIIYVLSWLCSLWIQIKSGRQRFSRRLVKRTIILRGSLRKSKLFSRWHWKLLPPPPPPLH